MPTSSRLPTYAPPAVTDTRRPRPLARLLRAALLLLFGLCAVVHGPTGDPHQSAPAVTAVSAPVASDGAPHGPHRHHGDAECADEAVRTTDHVAQRPHIEAGTAAFGGICVALGRPRAHRRAYRFRTRHTGRTALARTSRWRI